jgi:superfamily II DNA helicase RecQ
VFVEELTRPAKARSATAAAADRPTEPVTPTRRTDGAVVAERGLEVTLPGGFRGQVTAVERGVAHVRLDDDLDVEVAFGEPVEVDGQRTTLGAAPRGGRASGLLEPEDAPADEALVEALKLWRARTAAENGVPAYLVFHDRHLEAIAGRRPRTARELAACPGVGPAKLDRYADDVLDIIERHPA